jgi:hypothetical protein
MRDLLVRSLIAIGVKLHMHEGRPVLIYATRRSPFARFDDDRLP